MLDRAQAYARRLRAEKFSETVVYRRGHTGKGIAATRAETRVDNASGDVIVRSSVVDWIIELADIQFLRLVAGGDVTPVPGDKIIAAGPSVYEVMDLGGESCYRNHGRDGLSLRVHAKRVRDEPAATSL